MQTRPGIRVGAYFTTMDPNEKALKEAKKATEEVQKKPEKLTGMNDDLIAKHTASGVEISQLKNSHKEKDIAYDLLKGQYQKLTDAHADLQNESAGMIATLSKRIASMEDDMLKGIRTLNITYTNPETKISVDRKFQVHGKSFNIKGYGIVTIEQLIADEAIQRYLVDIRSGILTEIF